MTPWAKGATLARSDPTKGAKLTEISANDPAKADSWDGILANLRSRYPGQKDSVLFCLYKLQSNPKLGLPDFRDEAALHGIPMAGRALHSAKVLMGLAEQKPRAPRKVAAAITDEAIADETPTGRVRRERASTERDDSSIETKVLDAVRQIQSAASQEATDLRAAVREAITILQRALGD